MKKKITEDVSTNEVEPRVYEVAFWLVPTISESDLSSHHVRLQKRITDAGGTIISEEAPYLREAAYELIKVIDNVNKRFNDGYFGWMKFEMQPEAVIAVQDAFEADTQIIRSLVIKTVRENTTYTKRPEKKAFEVEEVVAEEIKEEVKAEEAPAVNKEEEVVA